MYDLILKKRNGEPLNSKEIDYFVHGYTSGNIPDYQISALLMAIFFQKMNKQETLYLTKAMIESGQTIDLSSIKGIKVDKHSTGGVGDKTTIALAPLVAACGVPVAKLSGRGLGHTGGTIDKLESIPGLSTDMSRETFIKNVNSIKLAVTGQTDNLVPADKKLYSLRDVTATVDNISLIASSIMSKKLASGADAIVLDVKTGEGAFMKNLDDSFLLAKEMVDIGNGLNKDTIAIVTDMNQPLGYSIGNSLEIKEALQLIKGEGPKDLKSLCICLASYMLLLSKKVSSVDEGRIMIEQVISSGKALESFKRFVKQQGGDISFVDNPNLLPKTRVVTPYKSARSGYIHKIQADIVGLSSLILGAGRNTKDSEIDLAVGIVLNKKIGDYVEKGDILAYIHSDNPNKTNECINKLATAYKIKNIEPELNPLIYGIVSKDGIIKLS